MDEEKKPEVIDTDTADAPKPEGEAPRKRGRPKGSKNRTNGEAPRKRSEKRATDIAAVAKQLQGLHQVIAMVSGMPEIVISEPESMMLANAIETVCEEYGLSMSGKTGAAIQLFGAAGIVYVPRMIAIRARIDAQNRAAENTQPGFDDGRTVENAAVN